MHIMNKLVSRQITQAAQHPILEVQEMQSALAYGKSQANHCANKVDALISKDSSALKESAQFSETIIDLSAHSKKSVHLAYLADHLLKKEQSTAKSLSNFAERGQTSELPQDLRMPIEEIIEGNQLNRTRPSDRCFALIGLYHAIDKTTLGRAAINISHITARNMGAVLLPTMIRQTVGHVLNQAMHYGLNETARTVLGMAFMMVPVVGQLMLGVKDELEAKATNYSRATRAVTVGLSLATGGASIVTQTMINPGLRFAETMLYPFLRDSVQAAIPILSNPESGPTKKSLLVTGTAYAFNQLAVSRALAAFPSSVSQKNDRQDLSCTGIVCQSAANAVGETFDLYTLCMLNHVARNGMRAEQPQLRMKPSNLLQAYHNQAFWDTVFARGSFVSAFNQFYDSMLASAPLTKALNSALGKANGSIAADWTTEAVAVLLTMATYPFWTDPLHTRGVDFSQASKLEAGNRDTFVQQHREPGLPDSFAARQSTVYALSFYK